jgi:hypothetical protein
MQWLVVFDVNAFDVIPCTMVGPVEMFDVLERRFAGPLGLGFLQTDPPRPLLEHAAREGSPT